LLVVPGSRVIWLAVVKTRGSRFCVSGRPGVDLHDRVPLRRISGRFLVPGSLWRGRRFRRRIELTGRGSLGDQLFISARIVANRFLGWRLVLGRGPADSFALRIDTGGDNRL
jgi:hypothetical protein